jgi:hypothetical protein
MQNGEVLQLAGRDDRPGAKTRFRIACFFAELKFSCPLLKQEAPTGTGLLILRSERRTI